MNDGSSRKLTPIHEISDLDLSFILSQLSSVSGEISEKTLEELLRDAESQPPSLSWCTSKTTLPAQVKDQLYSEPKIIADNYNLLKPLSCTNVFKSAIDSLTEMSAMVKEKISIDGESQSSQINVKKPVSNLKYKTNRATMLRKTINQPKTNLWAGELTRVNVKSLQSKKSTLKNKTIIKSNCTPTSMPSNSTKLINNIIGNKTFTRHNSRNIITKSAKKEKYSQVKSPQSSVTVGDAGSSTCRLSVQSQSNGTFSKHEESCTGNKTLRSKTNTARSSNSLALSSSPPRTKQDYLDKISHSKLSSICGNNPNPELQNLEAQFESLRLKYESQFQRLNEKCERLEKFETEWKAKKGELTEETTNTIPTHRGFGAQVDFQNNTLEPNLMPDDLALTKEKENVSKKCLNKFPNIHFDFDDLNLDSQFAPWQHTQNKERIPKLNFNNGLKMLKQDKSCNLLMSSGEHRKLLSSVKNLQSELDVLKKVNQRLRNQISNLSNRKSFGSRLPVKRTATSQTSNAYPDCCNFELSQDLTNRAVENSLLNNRIKELEIEMKVLEEKRQTDLTLLQRKHEEEIDNLLEQKMNLSKKLDSVRLWNAFEGIKGPGVF